MNLFIDLDRKNGSQRGEEHFDDFAITCETIKKHLKHDLNELLKKKTDALLSDRYLRFRKFGIYEENGETRGIMAYSI